MSVTRELACRDIVELVTAYLEDGLSSADRERFEEHLASCDGCDRYLEQMRLTITATRQVPVEDFPPELEERLLEAFRAWRSP
jgi:anti-sigma factor RsiW